MIENLKQEKYEIFLASDLPTEILGITREFLPLVVSTLDNNPLTFYELHIPDRGQMGDITLAYT